MEISPIEDSLGLRYKWANYYSTPLGYMVFGPQINEPDNVYPLITNLQSKYKPNISEEVLAFLKRQERLFGTEIPSKFNPSYQFKTVLASKDLNSWPHKDEFYYNNPSYFHLFRYVISKQSKISKTMKTAEAVTKLEVSKILNLTSQDYDILLYLVSEYYNNKNVTYPKTNINEYNSWLESYYEDVLYNLKNIVRLAKYQDIIIAQPPLQYEQFEVNKETLKGRVLWPDGREVEDNDGMLLFARSTVSLDIPYIYYNIGRKSPLFTQKKKDKDEEFEVVKTIRKIYNTQIHDIKNVLDIDTKKKNKRQEPYLIYFRVWLGAGVKTLAPKRSYVWGSYDTQTMEISIMIKRVPINNPTVTTSAVSAIDEEVSYNELIKDKVLRAFNIRVDHWYSTSMNVQFNVKNLSIKKYVLLELVLNDPVFSNYFYIDEYEKPGSSKKNIFLHYKSPFAPVDSEDKSIVPKMKFSYKHITTETILFSVIKVTTEYLDIIKNILIRIFSYYKQQDPLIMEFYGRYIPGFEEINEINFNSKEAKENNIAKLKAAAPGIFLAGYANKAQKTQGQAWLVEGITDWELENMLSEETFTRNGKEEHYQIMRFPPDEHFNGPYAYTHPTQVYLRSNNPEMPYIGHTKYNNLANSAIYPLLPKVCGKNKFDERNNYNEKYLYKKFTLAKNKTYYKKADKIADPERYAEVSTKIINLLRNKEEDMFEKLTAGKTNAKKLLRYGGLGATTSKSSILHAINYALADKDFNDASNPALEYYAIISNENKEFMTERLESFVAKQRLEIGKLVRQKPAIIMQENYDSNINDVITNLENNEIFLDPYLYYRALEEYFKINIFVFVDKQNIQSSNRGLIETISDQLEVPRHAQYYLRRRINRPTVMIYKFIAARKRNIDIPEKCELITFLRNNKDGRNGLLTDSTFDKNIIDTLYETFYKAIIWYQWSIKVNLNVTDVNENLIVGKSLNNADFSIGRMTHQILDDYGKCRLLMTTLQGLKFVIMILPTQPYNLPLLKIKNNLVLPRYQQIIDIFPNPPTAIRYFRDAGTGQKYINGLWFAAYRRKFAYYIPIENHKINGSVTMEIGPEPPIDLDVHNKESQRQRHIKLIKLRNVMLSVMEWLYSIFVTFPGQYDFGDFADLLYYENDESDSLNIYNFNFIDDESLQKYPIVDSFEEAWNYIKDNSQGFIRNIELNDGDIVDKIYMYNDDFYQSILYFISNLQQKRSIVVPIFLSEQYENINDFAAKDFNLIFLDENRFNEWLFNKYGDIYDTKYNQKIVKQSGNIIRNELDIKLFKETDPYLYNDGSRVYLIQNINNLGAANNMNQYKKFQRKYKWAFDLAKIIVAGPNPVARLESSKPIKLNRFGKVDGAASSSASFSTIEEEVETVRKPITRRFGFNKPVTKPAVEAEQAEEQAVEVNKPIRRRFDLSGVQQTLTEPVEKVEKVEVKGTAGRPARRFFARPEKVVDTVEVDEAVEESSNIIEEEEIVHHQDLDLAELELFLIANKLIKTFKLSIKWIKYRINIGYNVKFTIEQEDLDLEMLDVNNYNINIYQLESDNKLKLLYTNKYGIVASEVNTVNTINIMVYKNIEKADNNNKNKNNSWSAEWGLENEIEDNNVYAAMLSIA